MKIIAQLDVSFICYEPGYGPCADPENFVGGGPTLMCFLCVFLDDEGREDKNATKSSQHRLTSETPLKWRFAGGPKMAQHRTLA